MVNPLLHIPWQNLYTDSTGNIVVDHILELVAAVTRDLKADRIDMVDVMYVEHTLGWIAVDECLRLVGEV